MKVSFDTDQQRALTTRATGPRWRSSPRRRSASRTRSRWRRLADALPVERAASRWIVSDDPDEQVERIEPYVDLGFTHLVFHAPGPDQERFLDLYAEEVLPRLRERYGGSG